MKRPGFYVNGRRYPLDTRAQAIARAEFIAEEYGRHVPVIMCSHDGIESVCYTAYTDPPMELVRTPALLMRQAG